MQQNVLLESVLLREMFCGGKTVAFVVVMPRWKNPKTGTASSGLLMACCHFLMLYVSEF